jgi:hypothetical protein
MEKQGEVLVAFEPESSGGGSVFVYGDPFAEQPQVPLEVLVSPYSTPLEVMQQLANVFIAWGYMHRV